MYLNTEDLVSSIKARSLIPTGQQTYSDQKLIDAANEKLQGKLVPKIMSVREDFFLDTKTSTIISGLNHYRIAERAIGNSLKKVTYVDSNGNEFLLPRGSVEDVINFSGTGAPQKYYLKGDEIILLPTPSLTGTLKQYYFSRPNKLVATTSCAKITAISSLGGTTTLTVDTDLSASLSVGSNVDFLSLVSPFMLWAKDVAITAITSSTIAVATTSVSNEVSSVLPVVGDYICPAQQANVPMVPQELHPILAEMVNEYLMEALGDVQKLQFVKLELKEMEDLAFKMIENRVEADSQHVKKRYGILNTVASSRTSQGYGLS